MVATCASQLTAGVLRSGGVRQSAADRDSGGAWRCGARAAQLRRSRCGNKAPNCGRAAVEPRPQQWPHRPHSSSEVGEIGDLCPHSDCLTTATRNSGSAQIRALKCQAKIRSQGWAVEGSCFPCDDNAPHALRLGRVGTVPQREECCVSVGVWGLVTAQCDKWHYFENLWKIKRPNICWVWRDQRPAPADIVHWWILSFRQK